MAKGKSFVREIRASSFVIIPPVLHHYIITVARVLKEMDTLKKPVGSSYGVHTDHCTGWQTLSHQWPMTKLDLKFLTLKDILENS